jgi:hypothetical protein
VAAAAVAAAVLTRALERAQLSRALRRAAVAGNRAAVGPDELLHQGALFSLEGGGPEFNCVRLAACVLQLLFRLAAIVLQLLFEHVNVQQ